MNKLVVLGLVLGLSAVFLTGCAAWRASEVAADTARTIGVALVEKANFEQMSAEAGGSIEDPTYEVLAVYVQGILLRVGVDGVEVGGQIRGAGSGPDKRLSPETLEALRARGLGPDEMELLIQALLEAAREPGNESTSWTPAP